MVCRNTWRIRNAVTIIAAASATIVVVVVIVVVIALRAQHNAVAHTLAHTLALFECLLDYFHQRQRLLVISCGCCYCCGCVKCQRQGLSAVLAALAPHNDIRRGAVMGCTMPFVSAYLQLTAFQKCKEKLHSICIQK